MTDDPRFLADLRSALVDGSRRYAVTRRRKRRVALVAALAATSSIGFAAWPRQQASTVVDAAEEVETSVGVDSAAPTTSTVVVETPGDTEVTEPEDVPFDRCRTVPEADPVCQTLNRRGHFAVWTGTELLVIGGIPAGFDEPPPYKAGFAFDPVASTLRPISATPIEEDWGPIDVAWVQNLVVVVGMTIPTEDFPLPEVLLSMYDPSSDTWENAPAFPGDKVSPGAVVFADDTVLLVGGNNFFPDDTAWEFDLVDREWRQLPDPGIEPVEEMSGVWTGTEAIFYGGYAGTGPSPTPSPGVAYDPVRQTWRDLEPPDGAFGSASRMVWTGRETLYVPSFESGGGERTGLRYDPGSGIWSELAAIPVASVSRGSVGWNGDQVFTWGGADSDDSSASGALYDPATNIWSPVPNPPYPGRCQHTITWAVDRFIVVGGQAPCSGYTAEPVPILTFSPTTGEWETINPALAE